MSTIALGLVIIEGNDASKPAAGSLGRIYWAIDTHKVYYDNGSAWDNVTPTASASFTKVALAPAAAGDFTVAHGLGAAPSAVAFEMTSGGIFWLQQPTAYDTTNLYLVASGAGITGNAICFH